MAAMGRCGKSGPHVENNECRDSEMGTYHKGQGGWNLEGQVVVLR